MMELVSVIIPVYNHADYISQAMESVFAQTYEKVELIVIDDCSQDGSLAVVEKFINRPKCGKRFANVVVKKNSYNLGAAASINAGLEIAAGEWLTILNSDDLYLPKRLEKMIEALNSANKNHGFSGLSLINETGTPMVNHHFWAEFLAQGERIESYGVGFVALHDNIAFTSGNLFLHRSIYEKVGDFANLELAHDWDYLVRMLAIEEPAFVNEPLYAYRLHGCNAHHNASFAKKFDPTVVYGRYFRALTNGNYQNPFYPLYQGGPNSARMGKFRELVGIEPINFEELRTYLYENMYSHSSNGS